MKTPTLIFIASDETKEDAINRAQEAWDAMPDADPNEISAMHRSLFGMLDKRRTCDGSVNAELTLTRNAIRKQVKPFNRLPLRDLESVAGVPIPPDRPMKPKVPGWQAINRAFQFPGTPRKPKPISWNTARQSLQFPATTRSIQYAKLLIPHAEYSAQGTTSKTVYHSTKRHKCPWPHMEPSDEIAVIRFARTLSYSASIQEIPFYPGDYHGAAVFIEHFHVDPLEPEQLKQLLFFANDAAEACNVSFQQSGQWFEVFNIDPLENPEDSPDVS